VHTSRAYVRFTIRLYIFEYKFNNLEILILHFKYSTFGTIMSQSGRVSILLVIWRVGSVTGNGRVDICG